MAHCCIVVLVHAGHIVCCLGRCLLLGKLCGVRDVSCCRANYVVVDSLGSCMAHCDGGEGHPVQGTL